MLHAGTLAARPATGPASSANRAAGRDGPRGGAMISDQEPLAPAAADSSGQRKQLVTWSLTRPHACISE